MTDTGKSSEKGGLFSKFKKEKHGSGKGIMAALATSHGLLMNIEQIIGGICHEFDGKDPEKQAPVEDHSIMTLCTDIERRLLKCIQRFREFQDMALVNDNPPCDIVMDKATCFQQYVETMTSYAITLEREAE